MAAPVFEKKFVQDIRQPVRVRRCGDLMFTGDAKADTIYVEVYNDGVPYNLTGTVTLNCIRADCATVAVTGSISGNVAQATLAQACCAISGPLAVVMKITSGDVTSTILKAVYTVDVGVTGTTVDPGTIVSNVNTLIAAIETATASVPADYSDLLAAIAPTYSNSSTYAVGDYVWYDGNLYRCTTAIATAESWTAAHWTAAVLSEDVDEGFAELKSAVTDLTSAITAKMELENSGHNLCNPADIKQGFITNAGVEYPSSTQYEHTGLIHVTEGAVIRGYRVSSGTLAIAYITYVTAYDANGDLLTNSGSGSAYSYTVPSGVDSIIVSMSKADAYMVTSDYEAQAFEAYTSPYYIARAEFIESAVGDLMDDTLADDDKIAPASVVGDALAAKVSISQGVENKGKTLVVNGEGNLDLATPVAGNVDLPLANYGISKTIIRDETSAKVAIDNSNLTAPIANGIKSNIMRIAGTSDGTYPTGFVAYSKNLLRPELVCACSGNQSAGYQVNMSTPSTAGVVDNGDGTFDVQFALGWSNGLMLSAPLTVGETYEVYLDRPFASGCANTVYTLSSTYAVVRKVKYVAAAVKKIFRLKLETGEKYIGISFGSASNTSVLSLTVSYPEIRVSKTKVNDSSVVEENAISNVYWYQPYKKTVLSFDVDAITALFPGFGQANDTKVNVIYPAEKYAFQYGYYTGSTWTDDVKKIDLSEVITDASIDVSPNGTLEMLYIGATAPTWTVEYVLTISEPYTGYIWSGMGDSITAGADSGNGIYGFYRQDVRKTVGLLRYNDCGVGTSALSGVGTYKAMWTDERVEALPIDSDVITIMGGTNDTAQLAAETTPTASMTGWGDASLDNSDCTTFIGAYNVLISKIMYKFCQSSGYYNGVDYTGLTQVENVKPWFRLVLIAPPPVFSSADTIEAMTKICECVHKVGALWGLPVVNAHDNLGINDANKAYYFGNDYIHPDQNVHQRLANLIVAKAREID